MGVSHCKFWTANYELKEELEITSQDVLIVGCGLAGAAMAWQAHRRGCRVTIVDHPTPDSCSRVAAGLVTPITGSRAAASWRWGDFYSTAREHYLQCESSTGTQFWSEKPALRIFQSDEERQRAILRWCGTAPGIGDASAQPKMRLCDDGELDGYTAPWGGAWMEPAARLDTQGYLDSTLQFMALHQRVLERELVLLEDAFQQVENKIRVHELEASFDHVVLCQGFASRFNPWFSNLPLHPARGDILTVRIHEAAAYTSVVHASSWLVPLGQGQFLTGATYDRQTLDGIVDERESVTNARTEVIQRLGEYLSNSGSATGGNANGKSESKTPNGEGKLAGITIDKQRASVRPASYDRHPLIGSHQEMPQLHVLNGLGSKGTLMAPGLADLLCESMLCQKSIDTNLVWNRQSKRRKER